MNPELVTVVSAPDWADYHSIRKAVLWTARGRSDYYDQHADEDVLTNHPLLLKLEGTSIGTVRLDDFGDGTGGIRLVAIKTDRQRLGHGRVLSDLVLRRASALGLSTLFVNAAHDAIGYYQKTGWSDCSGHVPERLGMAADCRQMWVDLQRPTNRTLESGPGTGDSSE